MSVSYVYHRCRDRLCFADVGIIDRAAGGGTWPIRTTRASGASRHKNSIQGTGRMADL